MRPPFIIIGMHRSGTSFLAKVLERSGIFMGVVKDPNFEAMHFLSVNQQVLWAAQLDWHKPGVPNKDHWTHFTAEVLYREHFRLNGRWARFKQWLRREDWGWKDPRNTFTLDMWLHLFPEAKVIHMHRNTDAVVQSLQKRNERKGEVFAEELRDTQFCLELHQKYVDQARSYASQLEDRYLEIDYTKLCNFDHDTISKLEAFTGKKIESHLKKLVHA